jgi:hypothetical protein
MFKVKTQLSVVIANRPGILSKICDKLGSHQINIEGLSAYGEREHGIVRLVTSDPDRAAQLLSDAGFLVTRTDILAVKLTNRPAGLARLARQLAAHRINIDYSYGSAASAGRMATIYLRVANPARACQLLGTSAPGAKQPARPARARDERTRADAGDRTGGKKNTATKVRTSRDRRTVRGPRSRR